jgi:hypothetical protein
MGSFIAWLLGIPTAALVLAYVAICASIVSAKRRMADQHSHAHQPALISAFHSHTRNTIGQVQVMARRGGS